MKKVVSNTKPRVYYTVVNEEITRLRKVKLAYFFLPLKILRERPLLVQNVQRSPSELMRWTSDPDPRSYFPFPEKQQNMDTKF